MFEYRMKLGGGLEPVLIGIVDSSIEDCSTMLATPTVLSNVGFYRSWIEKKIKFWNITIYDDNNDDNDGVYFIVINYS